MSEAIHTQALVIGAGPAGLMAAEQLALAGCSVLVAEAKPSPARKFLMAGKSGLNLTKVEPFDRFTAAYGESEPWLKPMIEAFGPSQVQAWARGLGVDVFSGSTGRVFPVQMKASPLLRAWLLRLAQHGVVLRRQWRWLGWDGPASVFATPDGTLRVNSDTTVLALGGASWARLGSDGKWAQTLAQDGHTVTAFAPSNVGVSLAWSPAMAPHFGSPIKGVALRAGHRSTRSEFVISHRGLEGSAVYQLGPQIRAQFPLTVDLKPQFTTEHIADLLHCAPRKLSLSNRLRRVLKLSSAQIALFYEFAPQHRDPDSVAAAIKSLTIVHQGTRPIDEAISTCGGLAADALTSDLMLTKRPGTFCAGEMLDWDAPTGGYLLTACFATGRVAGVSAANWLAQSATRGS